MSGSRTHRDPKRRRNAVLQAGTVFPTFRIKSSSTDDAYLAVVQLDGRVTCSCPGFKFSHECKHSRRAKSSFDRRVAEGRLEVPR